MRHASTGFGAGKVILLGEHAVVHGGAAIAAGLRRGVTTVARPADRDVLHIAPWGRALRPYGDGNDSLARAFDTILTLYGDRPSLCVNVVVELPPGAGLGCSAAIGVSVIDAIDKALGIERSRDELGELALQWERFFHGTPSGIDNAAAAIGGVIRFERGSGASKLSPRAPLHLVVAHSGQRSHTKDMLARITRQLEQQPGRTRQRLDEVGALVVKAEIAIEQGDTLALGRDLDRNHDVLRALGLSTPRIEELRKAARSAGALGAKVTGAGGGGCVIALAEDADHAVFVANALGPDAFVEEVARVA
jgi:mevalonate kinase